MEKRYHKSWITTEEKKKRKWFQLFRERIPRVWVDYNELLKYADKFPKGHKFFIQEFDEGCEKGHTYRQIMTLEPLDCDCKTGGIEEPNIFFLIKN